MHLYPPKPSRHTHTHTHTTHKKIKIRRRKNPRHTRREKGLFQVRTRIFHSPVDIPLPVVVGPSNTNINNCQNYKNKRKRDSPENPSNSQKEKKTTQNAILPTTSSSPSSFLLFASLPSSLTLSFCIVRSDAGTRLWCAQPASLTHRLFLSKRLALQRSATNCNEQFPSDFRRALVMTWLSAIPPPRPLISLTPPEPPRGFLCYSESLMNVFLH